MIFFRLSRLHNLHVWNEYLNLFSIQISWARLGWNVATNKVVTTPPRQMRGRLSLAYSNNCKTNWNWNSKIEFSLPSLYSTLSGKYQIPEIILITFLFSFLPWIVIWILKIIVYIWRSSSSSSSFQLRKELRNWILKVMTVCL